MSVAGVKSELVDIVRAKLYGWCFAKDLEEYELLL